MAQAPAISSTGMWAAAFVAAAVFLLVATLLSRWMRPPWPPWLGGRLLAVGPIFFAVLFAWAFRTFWESCYASALPPFMKNAAPLIGAGVGAFGWTFWWLARRAGPWAVPVFLALGALESIPGHLNAVYRFGLLERCPVLEGVSPLSALVFGLSEFGLYWCAVLGASRMCRPGRRRGAG